MNVALKLVILDSDLKAAALLQSVCIANPSVESCYVASSLSMAIAGISSGNFNSVFIDPFGFSVQDAVSFIERIRQSYQYVPFCLYSSSPNLTEMPKVDPKWKGRFQHYYALSKGLSATVFHGAVAGILPKLGLYLLRHMARAQLEQLQASTTDDKRLASIPETKRTEIVQAISMASAALESHPEQLDGGRYCVAGIGEDAISADVERTIAQTKRDLRVSNFVNIGVLVFGAALVAASFIMTSVTGEAEGVFFGAFGLAGIIGSLVSNPRKSIARTAGRLVHIKTAYLAFMNQLTILGPSCGDHSALERSERLGQETERLLKTLSDS